MRCRQKCEQPHLSEALIFFESRGTERVAVATAVAKAKTDGVQKGAAPSCFALWTDLASPGAIFGSSAPHLRKRSLVD